MFTLARIVARTVGRAWAGAALMMLGLAACSSIGPGAVSRDRVDYIDATAESWKKQMLLNIVRTRYGDAATFFDVSSVVSSYTLQGNLSVAGETGPDIANRFINPSVGGTYIDRPTISYTPLSGEKFTRSLLTPLPPSAIFELVQAGYAADFVLRLTVRALNGIYNRSSIGVKPREADPEFYLLLGALGRLQASGAVSLRLEKHGADERAILILSDIRTEETKRDVAYVLKTLNLEPDKNGQLTIIFGALPRDRRELAVLSRSMSEILVELAGGIDVPSDHVARGWTVPSRRPLDAADPNDRPLVRIYSGPAAPADAFVAVRYRYTSYWIDYGDMVSKRSFTFLMSFFRFPRPA
jgi:hypothetical protein